MNNESMIVSLKGQRHTQEPERRPSQKRRFPRYALPIVIGVLALAGGGSFYIYSGVSGDALSEESVRLQSAAAMTATTAAGDTSRDDKALAEIDDIIAQVGKHIRLPKDEVPTVATVSDPEKLKDQTFFANAKVGNKVLIYTKAHKAYLFDAEADILIEVAPITTDSME